MQQPSSLSIIRTKRTTDGIEPVVKRMRTQVFCIYERSRLPSVRYPALVDIDLTNRRHVEILKSDLPRRSKSDPLLFAITPGDRTSLVQARILGGSFVVSKPVQVDEIERCLARLAPADEEPEPEIPSVHHSITRTAEALETAMGALRAGKPLDIEPMSETCRAIVAAMQEVGIGRWLEGVRIHHEGTFQHCLLVAGVASAFAAAAKMNPRDTIALCLGALLHDIGKAVVPKEILDKPDKLTPVEYAIVKRHPVEAHDFLRSKSLASEAVLRLVRDHHEFLDGSGYPAGLSGDAIDGLTRCLTVCDIYSALVEERSYRPPATTREALKVLFGLARDGKIDLAAVRMLALVVDG